MTDGFVIIPYKRIVFDVALTPNDASQILGMWVSSRVRWRFPRNARSFEGTISPRGFDINLVSQFSRRSIMHLFGRFDPLVNGSHIVIFCTMDSLTWILLGFVSFLWIAGGILLLMKDGLIGLLPLGGFFATVYLPSMIAFNHELHKAARVISIVFSPHESD
jgi:hypothetical protein